MRVLLVEDSTADARLVNEMLKESGPNPDSVEVAHVRRIGDAVTRLAAERFDVVLLDLGLPDAYGLEALTPIRASSPEMPVVVLSGRNDADLAVSAVQKGAQDYLLKGEGDGPLLARALRYAIERKRSEQHIFHIAHHDGLTDLPNRRLLLDRLGQALARSRRDQRMLALLFLDLDDFKIINDTYGHAAGDRVLQEVALRLRAAVRESDTVARLGGDEFTLMLSDIGSIEDVARLATKVLNVFKTPIHLPPDELHVSASMGISLFPDDGETAEALLRTADAAMYRAKQHGPDVCEFHSTSAGRGTADRRSLTHGLRRALDGGEFVLHYQPQIQTLTGKVVGVEVLLRWAHPEWGLLPPSRFVPVAEELGLIEPIGRWVLRRACLQGREWNTRAPDLPLRICVNLSSREFSQRSLLPTVERILADTDLPPGLLELELTEGGIMRDEAETTSHLCALNEMGVRISIDDFGTGYSSLSRLKRFPIDALKIDRSFVRDVVSDASDAAIVSAIITMGHGLHLRVVAEGVEDAEQALLLREHGCDEMQGHYFGMPLPAEEIGAVLARPLEWKP